MSKFLRFSFWLVSALALRVLALAVWIGLLLAEPTYQFSARVRSAVMQTAVTRPTVSPAFSPELWRLIVICRYVGWALPVLSLVDLVLYVRLVPARRDSPRFRRRLMAFSVALICTLVLVAFWVQLMMPTASLEQGTRGPRTEKVGYSQ